jgi:SpoVK/Ycf46/Vps4 family AAA+-type ATPase
MVNEYYKTSLEHLSDELQRIDLLLINQYRIAKHQFENKGEFQGLYISDHDVDSILKKPMDHPLWRGAGRESSDSSSVSEDSMLRRNIDEKLNQSRANGVRSRLDQLTGIFDLESWDVDILLVCLAPELNSGYEKVYAYLQDDMTRRKPSVELVLNILCPTFQEKIKFRKRLMSGAPLVEHHLIHVSVDPACFSPPFISRFLHVDERIVNYLLDEEPDVHSMDRDLNHAVDVVHPSMDFNDLIFPESTKSALQNVSDKHSEGACTVLYFHGPYGTGRKSAAQAVCKRRGKRMLVADFDRLMGGSSQDFCGMIRKVMREADLQNALIYWNHGEVLFPEDRKALLDGFMDISARRGALSFLSGRNPWEPRNHLPDGFFVPFEFPCPSYAHRITLWERHVAGENLAADVNPERLAAPFSFSGGQIRDAVQTARNLSLKKDGGPIAITAADLHIACRLQSNRKLAELARQIKPTSNWVDIVLPEDRLEQLKDIVNHARYRTLVLDSWGFGRKLSYGKGLSVLFSGPSGTGKTMAAEIMAEDLGLYLYKIDLARVVSKYIGETEKNLSRIFEEAETSNAILFFDEADAIFGKRSEVHDAHDRYANIETSYLLQKMEEYEGITILATNFKRNMDDAFVRRIQYAVDFPFPEKHDRHEIWKKIWPHELPLAKDIDFDFLAGRFEMSGGNIKNICLNAAFLAAADGKTVTMNHLMKATRNEYRKMGKLMVGGDFAELKRVTG